MFQLFNGAALNGGSTLGKVYDAEGVALAGCSSVDAGSFASFTGSVDASCTGGCTGYNDVTIGLDGAASAEAIVANSDLYKIGLCDGVASASGIGANSDLLFHFKGFGTASAEATYSCLAIHHRPVLEGEAEGDGHGLYVDAKVARPAEGYAFARSIASTYYENEVPARGRLAEATAEMFGFWASEVGEGDADCSAVLVGSCVKTQFSLNNQSFAYCDLDNTSIDVERIFSGDADAFALALGETGEKNSSYSAGWIVDAYGEAYCVCDSVSSDEKTAILEAEALCYGGVSNSVSLKTKEAFGSLVLGNAFATAEAQEMIINGHGYAYGVSEGDAYVNAHFMEEGIAEAESSGSEVRSFKTVPSGWPSAFAYAEASGESKVRVLWSGGAIAGAVAENTVVDRMAVLIPQAANCECSFAGINERIAGVSGLVSCSADVVLDGVRFAQVSGHIEAEALLENLSLIRTVFGSGEFLGIAEAESMGISFIVEYSLALGEATGWGNVLSNIYNPSLVQNSAFIMSDGRIGYVNDDNRVVYL